MQEIKEIFFWLQRPISKSVLYKFRQYKCHLPAELVPQLSSWKGVLKNNFGKKNFMQSMAMLSMQSKKVQFFSLVGGRRGIFFPPLCSQSVLFMFT
jgi:hypothetical protein